MKVSQDQIDRTHVIRTPTYRHGLGCVENFVCVHHLYFNFLPFYLHCLLLKPSLYVRAPLPMKCYCNGAKDSLLTC